MAPELKFVRGDAAEHIDSDIGAGGGVWFNRQLEMIEQEILRAKRPAKNGLILFPVVANVPEGAEKYTRRMYDSAGRAKTVGSYGDDLPRAQVFAQPEDSVTLKREGAAYGYNIDELAAVDTARRTGQTIDLPTERAIATRDMIEARLNEIVWNGDPATGRYGVLNHPVVPRYAMPNASTAAVDTVIANLAAVFNQVKLNTRDVEEAKRLMLASNLYNYLSTRLRTNTDSTLLDILAKVLNIPRTDIVGVQELNGAGDGGGDAVIADRKDRLVMAHILSVPWRQEPVERHNLEYLTNCTAKSGGMMASYPMAVCIGSFPNAIS
jgi:hypothetical protein